MRLLWMVGGGLSLALGIIGIVLPLLPTTPFLILSAFCFARSSERVHDWLINQKIFGPMIGDWRRHGAIRQRAKLLATLSIAAVFTLSLVLGVATPIVLIQAAILLAVLIFIWTRPGVRTADDTPSPQP